MIRYNKRRMYNRGGPMNNLNKKGFTMVELLAVVTILGVLAIVAIPSTKYLIERGKENYYVAQKNQIELAAKEYLKDNPQLLPGEVGGNRIITLRELIAHKYISNVKNQNKENCDKNETTVKVTRISKTKYTYAVTLICPDYKDKKESNTINPKPIIDYEIVNKNIGDDNTSSTVEFKIKITIRSADSSSGTRIKYYKYRVLSGGSVLEEKEYEVLSNEINKTIDLSEYVKKNQTRLKIEVRAVAANNEEKTEIFEVDAKDSTAPKCPNMYSDTTIEEDEDNNIIYLKQGDRKLFATRNSWDKKPQTITAYCYDTDDANKQSSCKNNQYTITLKKDTDIGKTFKMTDSVGNTVEGCTIPADLIRIDTTAPTIDLRMKALDYNAANITDINPHNTSNPIYNEDWFKGKVFTKVYASDNPPTGHSYAVSGLDKIYLTTTGKDEPNENKSEKDSKMITKEGTSVIEYKVCDIAGNCAKTGKHNIKLDRTAPNCSTSYSSPSGYKDNDWTNQNVTLLGTCSETGDVSGCKTQTIQKTFSQEMDANQNPGSVEDNAGNTTQCGNKKVRIDTHAPASPTIKMYKKAPGCPDTTSSQGLSEYTQGFSSRCLFVEPTNATDNLSGIGSYKYTFAGPNGNSSGTANYIELNTEGNYPTITFQACDKAGNCSGTSSASAKIDLTAPTINNYTVTTQVNSYKTSNGSTVNAFKSPRAYANASVSDTGGSGLKSVTISADNGGICYQDPSNDITIATGECGNRTSFGGAVETILTVTDNAGLSRIRRIKYTPDTKVGSKTISCNDCSYVAHGEYGCSLFSCSYDPLTYQDYSLNRKNKQFTYNSYGYTATTGYPMYYFACKDSNVPDNETADNQLGKLYNCRATSGDVLFKISIASSYTKIGEVPPHHRTVAPGNHQRTSTTCYPSGAPC